MGAITNGSHVIFGNNFCSWYAEIILHLVPAQMGYRFLYSDTNLLDTGDKFIYEIICIDKIQLWK